MRKLLQEDYIQKCKEIHKDKYDYSLVEYIGLDKKIKIVCINHGCFEQNAKNHKDGQGCPRCVGRNLTKEEFINISKNTHRNEYEYLSEIRSKKYIIIKDKESGLIYRQLSDHHKSGITPTKIEKKSLFSKLSEIHKNKYQYSINKDYVGMTDKLILFDNNTGDVIKYRVDRHLNGMVPNKVTLNYFIKKGNDVHNNKYDYSLVKFNKGTDKVDIICPEHGLFTQRVTNHLNLKDGCPKCSNCERYTREKIIERFNRIHFGKYDYSLISEDVKSKNKISIICREHGVFTQNINKHLNGQGCKMCTQPSKGEEYIKMYLIEKEIKCIHQHGFDTCRNINKLNFDFYLPEHNTCIEFDGLQHFKPVKEFGGEKCFLDGIKRDEIKNKWCLENNVTLIRIRYDEIDKIRDILDKKINIQ
jgi:very-short-patch-repair endonuclease